MIELYIFNKDLELLGIIDEFEELLWERKYRAGANFILKLVPNKNNLNLIKTGNLICKKDDLKELMYIEYIEYTTNEEEKNNMLIKGISLTDRILKSRITLKRQIEKGTANHIMNRMLLKQTNESDNERRHIKKLVVNDDNSEQFKNTYEYNSIYKYLDEEFKSISKMDNCGFKIEVDLNNKQYIFKTYRGRDLSKSVIFSRAFDNISTEEYINSEANYKNVCVIAGQGEEEKRDLLIYKDEDFEDFDRIELMIDARDIPQDKEKNGDKETAITNGKEAIKLLTTRAKEKLEEKQIINNYTADIINNNFKYKKDFDIGDIVSIRNDEINLLYSDTITEIYEEYKNGYLNIEIVFGTELITLQDKIKKIQ